MENLYYLSADGKSTIHASIWRPEGALRGVVQIIHGMCEYAERYSPFAEFLTANGFLVCAEDHLGHGKSAEESKLGWFDDEHNYNTVIADIKTLFDTVKKDTPDIPHFVLGHSMGSFFCRKFISLYGGELDGAVVMGTGFMGKALMNTALTMTKLNAAVYGWENKSKFIKSLAFGSYNKRFKADNDPNAWLSVDKDNVIKYNQDGLCGFEFTDNGYFVLFSIIKAACDKKTVEAVPKDLPVYFVAGADDPVGNYGKGVKKAYNAFKKAGVKDLSITLYEGARHEILNDTVKERVQQDILAFFVRLCHAKT